MHSIVTQLFQPQHYYPMDSAVHKFVISLSQPQSNDTREARNRGRTAKNAASIFHTRSNHFWFGERSIRRPPLAQACTGTNAADAHSIFETCNFRPFAYRNRKSRCERETICVFSSFSRRQWRSVCATRQGVYLFKMCRKHSTTLNHRVACAR